MSDDPQKILRTNDLAARWGVDRTTLWRWQQENRLPPPLKMGPNTRGWRLSTIEQIEASWEGAA